MVSRPKIDKASPRQPSPDLGALMRILLPGRAPTQRRVIISLLRGYQRPEEIAADLGLSVNAVRIALMKLIRSGAARRPRRGLYEAHVGPIALALLLLLDDLHSRRRRSRRYV
jgi:DNA-directed RNA polymerase specialized sigma24 family protein